jgi:preprotein translocase subunit SecF
MNLNFFKKNSITILISGIIALILILSALYFAGSYGINSSQNTSVVVKKDVTPKKYYTKKAPSFLNGFTIDEIGNGLFVSITSSPCTYYRQQAINYLNTEFKKPAKPEHVFISPQGSGVGDPQICYKGYTLE